MTVSIGTVIQARMGSRRLPGKVLLPLAGRPILEHVVRRVRACAAAGPVTVATSTAADDDAIAAWCLGAGVPVVRGSLDHVAQRFVAAADAAGLSAAVRITADSPLIDPALIDAVCRLYRTGAAVGPIDLATNVFPRGFPKGQSVEVITVDSLRRQLPSLTEPDLREHITTIFYRHPERFTIRALRAPGTFADEQFSVDTADDLARADALLRRVPHWDAGCGWAELRAVAAGVPL